MADTSNIETDSEDETLKEWLCREELMSIGISGGTSCKIWREILRSRMESSQKFDAASITIFFSYSTST
uniref:Uncharacterized protein n=1 Tax=Ditylenchus dipsaci TaxID=166011 RepID=A0A915EM73_9BILA